jgi:hypothetical protein
MMQTTGGSNTWAQSQVHAPPAGKSPPWLLLGGVAALLGVGLVAGLWVLLRSPAETPPAQDVATQSVASNATPTAGVDNPPAPSGVPATPPAASSAVGPEAKPAASAKPGTTKAPPNSGVGRVKPRQDDDFGY